MKLHLACRKESIFYGNNDFLCVCVPQCVLSKMKHVLKNSYNHSKNYLHSIIGFVVLHSNGLHISQDTKNNIELERDS